MPTFKKQETGGAITKIARISDASYSKVDVIETVSAKNPDGSHIDAKNLNTYDYMPEGTWTDARPTEWAAQVIKLNVYITSIT